MKTKEMDIVHIDNNPQNNHMDNIQPENYGLKQHGWMNMFVRLILLYRIGELKTSLDFSELR
jgi:hypothetical protein